MGLHSHSDSEPHDFFLIIFILLFMYVIIIINFSPPISVGLCDPFVCFILLVFILYNLYTINTDFVYIRFVCSCIKMCTVNLLMYK